MDILILLALCAVSSNIFGGKLRMVLVLSFAFGAFLSSAFLTSQLLNGSLMPYAKTVKVAFFTLNFGVDLLGMVFINLVSFLWGIAGLYSFAYFKANYPEKNDGIFQFCYSLAVFFAILFALARDVLTMFIIYELLTLSTIPLIAFKKLEEVKHGLFRYLTVLLGCSLAFLLPTTLFILYKTGIVVFDGGGFMGKYGISDWVLKVILLGFIFGVAKAAVFPFHTWLPAAMVAPTPVSGLLHAVAVVKVGGFFILRVVTDVFGLEELTRLLSGFNFLMYIAAFTILYASILAVFQNNLKKRLAYSTIAQISYILLSLSTFTKLGVFVAMFQIISHALTKILLFFTVGGFYTASHSNKIIDFGGMAQKNLFACLAFVFATISLCGLPMTIGFLNKGLLFYNVIQSKSYFSVFVFSVSAFLCFLYLIPVCYAIFKKMPARSVQNFTKIPLTFNIVFFVLVLTNVLFFIFGGIFFINYVNEW